MLTHPGYPAFLAALKERILRAHVSAARAVNHELVLLYWDIGRGIVEKQQTAGWGDAVVERLAADLRAEFPDMRGFSADNLWQMGQFFAEYSSPEFLEQAVPETISPLPSAPTGIMPGQPVQALAASHASAQSAEILAQVARELLVTVPWGHHVELLKKIKTPAARIYYLRAIAQFGWSRNVLLNQIKAPAYERAGREKKTHNYLNLLNDQERAPDDQPSIGIIFCAEKDDVEVEFALKTKSNPIGVTEYQFQTKLPAQFKGRLPTAKQLADAVRQAREKG